MNKIEAVKKRFARLTLVMMGVLALLPFAEVKNAEAKGLPVICYEDDTEDVTTEPSGGGINDLSVTMEGGQIKTSFDDKGDSSSFWATLFNKYKIFIIGISGIATLTFIVIFIINCIKVGANSGNPSGRRDALQGCLWTGIATAACGSVTVIVGLFWNAFV